MIEIILTSIIIWAIIMVISVLSAAIMMYVVKKLIDWGAYD